MTEPSPGPAFGQPDDRLGVMDVGGSHVHAALVRSDGPGPVLAARVMGSLDASGPREALLEQLAAPADTLAASAWAVALPGPFDYALGRGDFAGVGKFAALAGVDLRGELARRLRVRPERVLFLNDAVAYGLGEWANTAERPDRFVCITLGTGVGSAFLVSGAAVESGRGVPPRGWVHLLTVEDRPLEETVSTRAIVAAYRRRTGSTVDVRRIAAAARQGDRPAQLTLSDAIRSLGLALGPWLRDFGTQQLVVGGAMSRSWDLLERPLAEGLLASSGALPALASSALLDDAPLVGAAHWFRRRSPASSPVPRP